MHPAVPITEQIFWTGVNDRDTGFFEELWPMPRGISYNSYLIADTKVTLIDAVKAPYATGLLEKIASVLDVGRKVDYLIINHIEPDHSGAITDLRNMYPDMEIVGNEKTMEYLMDLYGIRDGLKTITDGDVLDLGRHRLKFFITPMVHWPETMMTYEETSGVLFSGDVFGGFGALESGIFDDEADDIANYEDEALRYFSNVLGKYSMMVRKALFRVADLDIRTTASMHGILWRGRPRRIVELYDRWSRFEADNSAVIIYASMYGNTERMMNAIAQALSSENVREVKVHNVSRSHASYIVADVWRSRAVVIGSPTYNTGLFPLVDFSLRILENKGIKDRIAGIFGSYGWAGGGMKELRNFVEKMSWELVEPAVDVKGAPTKEVLEQCARLGTNIAKRLGGA